MGLLIDGQWTDQWYDTKSTGGRFVRSEAQFRNWITPDGSAGPSGEGGFQAEPGRYHLYVSLACPWAHRTLVFRAIKQLDSMISVSVVNPLMARHGWTFEPDEGVVADHINHASYLHQLYTLAQPGYTGRVTVPVLWDKQRRTIVNNESSEIIRMLNSAFDGVGAAAGDYYPSDLRAQIDEINDCVYPNINNGVYRAGFATSQDVYEQAVQELFQALETLERRLLKQRYLVGNTLTEADWRLFTTLLRFDPVYYGHFKCNIKRLVDFPALWGHTRELFQRPGVAATVNMHHIKHHYYRSHVQINPTGIVPTGPQMDFQAPHQRELV